MNFIFLYSMPRSGSTLLRRQMENASSIITLPETHFFLFYQNLKSLSFKKNKQQIIECWINFYTVKRIFNNHLDSLRLALEDSTNFKNLFEKTILQYLTIENINYDSTKTILEKSPPHIFFIDDIKKMYPEHKKIFLIRDPRSVVFSLLTMPWSTHNIYAISRSWKICAKVISKYTDEGTTIRYEDIVNQNEEAYNSLKSHLSLNIDKNQFYQTNNNISGFTKNYHSNIDKPLNTKSIDKWKKGLSKVDREVEIIEKNCSSLMNQYKYKLSSNKYDLRAKVKNNILKLDFLISKFVKE